MTDKFSPEKRSQIMAAISGRETKPEVAVRSFLFSKGFRFRKNVKTLPGKPDIVLPKLRVIVLIHGCFWHGHFACAKGTLPASNKTFWEKKIQGNIERDRKVKSNLEFLGWKVITIWECELKNRNLFGKTMACLVKELSFQQAKLLKKSYR